METLLVVIWIYSKIVLRKWLHYSNKIASDALIN